MSKSEKQSLEDDDRRHEWQLRLLPFMVRTIFGLALFFFLATMYQLYELNIKIEQSPTLSESELILAEGERPSFVERQWRSLVMLESHILQQRYHQANVLLMARVWVRYLGFVTGMMLALIGAVFILGKLREPGTELSVEGKSADNTLMGNLKTQSPGIVLVSLGTILMLVTILVHHEIEVNDAPVYTAVTMTVQPGQKPRDPAKLDFDENKKGNNPSADQSRALIDEYKRRHAPDDEGSSQ